MQLTVCDCCPIAVAWGREEGTRELVLPRLPYIVVYRIRGEAVELLHVYHGAQNRP
jgi:toxin ParE1/3/4